MELKRRATDTLHITLSKKSALANTKEKRSEVVLRLRHCRAASFATVPAKYSMVNISAGASREGHKGGPWSTLEGARQLHRLRLSRGVAAAMKLHLHVRVNDG